MGCGLVTSFLRVYHHYHILQNLKDLGVFLGLGWFFFNLWLNNSRSCQAMRKRRRGKSCLNLLIINKTDITGSRVNLKPAKEWSVLVEQGLCKAGRKALPATLQRGIRCQCQWLLSNIHCPSQRGPSLPTCTQCTHLTAFERSLFILSTTSKNFSSCCKKLI